MGRILKTDLYRLFRGLAFYIFPAVLLMVLLFSISGEHASGMMASVEDILADLIETARYLTFIPVCCVVTYLWNSETRNGFIKNIAGNVKGREIPAVTKLITGAVVTVIYVVLTFVFIMISRIIGGYEIMLGSPVKMIAEVGYWILICFAVVALMELIHELTHSAALGYILSIAIWTGMVEEILIMVSSLIFKKFDITEYTLIYGFLIRGAGLFSFVRTMIYLAVFAGAAVIVAKKRDVKI